MATAQYMVLGKAKAGELKGWAHVHPSVRAHVVPFFDVPRPKDSTSKGVHEHLIRVADKISAHCSGSSIYIDHFDIPLNARGVAGTHPIDVVFGALKAAKITAIPVFGFDRDLAYFQAVGRICSQFGSGLCIRLLEDDMESPAATAREIEDLLMKLNTNVNCVDVILDFRSVVQKSLPVLTARGLNTINVLNAIGNFRSITVAGSNFPRTVGDIPVDDIGFVERRETLVWNNIRTALQGQTQLRFGDYSVVHPDFVDIENARNANAKIRYATGTNWIIARGHMLRESPGYSQYRELATRIADSPEFLGADFSWADRYIQDCANANVGPGNLAKWVEVDVCHHVTYVAQEVAKLIPINA